MKIVESSEPLLLCEECEWAFAHPSDINMIDNGFLGIDIVCTIAEEELILHAGWKKYAIEIAKE